MSVYLDKYHNAGAHLPGSGEKAILRFFGSLDLADWQDLLTDISKHQFGAYDVIRPGSPDFLVATARSLFARLSPQTRVLAARALGRLLVRFASASERDDQAVTELLLMAVSFKECAAAVRSLVLDLEVARRVRVEAARVLANFAEESESFWSRFDYREFPELTPSMVAALSAKAPLKGLQLLASLSKQPCPTLYLEYPVESAVAQLLSSRPGKIALLRLFTKLPSWATSLFARALELVGETQPAAHAEESLIGWEFAKAALSWKDDPEPSDREEGSVAKLQVRRADLIGGVTNLLEQWSPSLDPSDVPLETRIQLFERYPSRSALSALIAIGSFYIAKLRAHRTGSVDDKRHTLLILRAVISHAHVISIAKAGRRSEQNRTLLLAYRDLLQLSMENKTAAPVVFEAFLAQGVRPRRLGYYIVRAVTSGSMTIPTCHRILLKVRNEHFVTEVFRSMVKAVRKRNDPRLVVAMGIKIYDYSIDLLNSIKSEFLFMEVCEIQWRSKKVSRLRRSDPGRLLRMPSVRQGVRLK